MEGVKSVALAQIDFGAETPKPTRLLMRTEVELHAEMYEGAPKFDEEGFYVGPLPRKEGPNLLGVQRVVSKQLLQRSGLQPYVPGWPRQLWARS